MKVTINEKQLDASVGETILSVAQRNNIEIPTLCYQNELKPFASCFICAVEVEGMNRLVPSCATPVSDGMVIHTESDRVKASRKMCVELLFSDHVGDCHGPCQVSCPAGIDIPGFISLLASDREAEALKLIKETMPMPAALGRICPRPCEGECRRACEDDPVSICYLKRYVADYDLKLSAPYIPQVSADTGKKVAVIGSGPAGLAAAFYLRINGYAVDVFDAHEEAGGMLRYGIPGYRLPRDVLAKEIGLIEKMGVTITQNAKIGKDRSLKKLVDNYDALFLAIGCQSSSGMRADGENSEGVVPGISFLENAACGNEIDVGDRVVVVGGGNTAVDCARTSLRLGAKEVVMLYRRTRAEMPADAIEIEAAEEEGIKFEFLAAPTMIERVDDRLKITSIRMGLGESDASGRRRPVPKKGSEFEMDTSLMISAIGQRVESRELGLDELKIKMTDWGTIIANNDSLQTTNPKIFSGGDCVTGADIAVRAIEAGRRAATAIDQFLKNEKVVGIPAHYVHKIAEERDKTPKDVLEKIFEGIEKRKKERMEELKAGKRIKSFDEVEQGFTSKQAKKEAERCLACGCRSYESCTMRRLADTYKADPKRWLGSIREFHVDESHEKIRYESHKCIMCGSCIRVCSEVKHLDALGFVWRGFPARMRPQMEKPWKLSTCDACLKCVPMCPTGAISLKVTPGEDSLARMKGKDASKDVSKESV
ncbi:MAG: FAD-dependent oxidoreductase [Pseudomonadota bacterium]